MGGAFNVIGGDSLTGFVEFPNDVLAPAKPQNLTATPDDQQVTLNWSANIEVDLDQYRIYRNTENDSLSAELINSVSETNTSYLDDGLTNNTLVSDCK